jgi:ribosome-binding factor A
MPAPTRKQRLESLLHREIATVVNQELRDPRLGFVTITRVEMTADLHFVKAYFTVLGDEKQRNLAQKALTAATPFVQRSYAKAVRTRTLPQLIFAIDDQEERRIGMADLIRKARNSDPDPVTEEVIDPNAPNAPPRPPSAS